jgi:hypothetical protein
MFSTLGYTPDISPTFHGLWLFSDVTPLIPCEILDWKDMEVEHKDASVLWDIFKEEHGSKITDYILYKYIKYGCRYIVAVSKDCLYKKDHPITDCSCASFSLTTESWKFLF